MMLQLNTAPRAAATPARGAPADPAACDGVDFTDVLTQLTTPSGEGRPVDLKRLLRQALVPAPLAGVGSTVVGDGALSVGTLIPGDASVAPRIDGSTATTSDGKTADDAKEPASAPVAVIDIVLAPVQPVLQSLTAATPPAPEGVRLPIAPVPVPLGQRAGAVVTAAAQTSADSAQASLAGATATTGGPQTTPDRKTIPPAGKLEMLPEVPAPTSTPAGSAEGALTIPRPSMGKPAIQAAAMAALKLAAASPAASIADASPTAPEASGLDQEASRGDARSGGGHGQMPQNAPAPAVAQEGAVGPIIGSTTPTNGAPGSAVGQGVAPALLHPADAAELAPQIVQAIKVQWQGGTGEARIRLHPEYLGELTIAIRIERGGAVTASLEAGSSSVRQWLQTNESSLRQGLADQGLHLERLQVSEQSPRVTWDGEKPREEEQPSPNRKQSSRRRRHDEPTFEVVV
jgi:hypothetical protein